MAQILKTPLSVGPEIKTLAYVQVGTIREIYKIRKGRNPQGPEGRVESIGVQPDHQYENNRMVFLSITLHHTHIFRLSNRAQLFHFKKISHK
jgi:hypothetical protein